MRIGVPRGYGKGQAATTAILYFLFIKSADYDKVVLYVQETTP
jgi:hypothetical protein